MRTFLPLLFIPLLCTCVRAQHEVLRSKTGLYERTLNSLDTYQEFLSLPNDARKPAQLEPNLQWLEAQFGKRGFKGQRLENSGIDL
ncbi:MAG: hypothetical protein AAF597_08495, partial [Bacteroidota bacterium]